MAQFSSSSWRGTRLKAAPAEFYRHEAERIQSIAKTVRSSDLRRELVRIACLYERLAEQHSRYLGAMA
jgi:hypothetical protein